MSRLIGLKADGPALKLATGFNADRILNRTVTWNVLYENGSCGNSARLFLLGTKETDTPISQCLLHSASCWSHHS